MPDYHKPDLSAGNIPAKPRNFDEAARASLNADQRASEGNKAEGRAMQEDKAQRREAARRRAEATEKPGPAERIYGQDRFAKTDSPKPSTKRAEPSQAQLEMQAKRETARQQDREVAVGKKEPEKHYGELQKKDQSPKR